MNIATLLQNPTVMNEVVMALKANPHLTLHLLNLSAPNLMNNLDQIRDALYKGTSKEQQVFVTNNLGNIAGFLNTKSGAEAISEFITKWSEHVLPNKPEE